MLNILSGSQNVLSGCIIDPGPEKKLVPPFKKLMPQSGDSNASGTMPQLVDKNGATKPNLGPVTGTDPRYPGDGN